MVKGPTSEPPYDWITTSQAADRLGIAHRTLYRRIERERLPAYRLGRVFRLRAHEVDAWGKGAPLPPAPPHQPSGRQPNEVVDAPQAATYLGLSQRAFRRIVRSGVIPHTTVGRGGWRFTMTDLDRWLEDRARIRPGDITHLWDLGH